jgi:hypothetical protein
MDFREKGFYIPYPQTGRCVVDFMKTPSTEQEFEACASMTNPMPAESKAS